MGRLLCFKKIIKSIPLSPDASLTAAKQALEKVEYALNCEAFNAASEQAGPLRRPSWDLGPIRAGGMQLLEGEQRQAALFFTAAGEPLSKDEAEAKVRSLWQLPDGTQEPWFEKIRSALNSISSDATQYMTHNDQLLPLRSSALRNRMVYLYNVTVELLLECYPGKTPEQFKQFLAPLPESEPGFHLPTLWAPQIESPDVKGWADVASHCIRTSSF